MTETGVARHTSVRMSKHHGWGNDFLVVDATDASALPAGASRAELARRWCDRRTGIGADGLLFLERLGVDELSMELLNADASSAEMSGNGIRCLVQAAHRAIHGDAGSMSWPVTYRVHTGAGLRTVEVLGPEVDGCLWLSVDMGTVDEIEPPRNWAAVGCHEDRPVRHVSLGNPHAVVGVDDVNGVDLESLGRLVPDVNLEIVAPGPEVDAVTMRVHERGAGLTLACGTGACAAAEAAVAWGLVPSSTPEVLVHMPGGDARVQVESGTRTVHLIGPAVWIGTVTVDM